jgi:transcription-repair coupling factor (superfamily II helicase)
LLIRNLQENDQRGYTNFIFAENPKQIERFYAIFDDLKVKPMLILLLQCPKGIFVLGIHQGFIDDDLKLAATPTIRFLTATTNTICVRASVAIKRCS